MILDFHVHTFPAGISKKVLDKLSHLSHTDYFTDGSVQGLISSMQKAHIDYSVNLPVMTTPKQVQKINTSLIEDREELYRQHIITFGGIHPDFPDYKEELSRLKKNGIPGIKIHPAYQNTDLDDMKMMRIVDYASELDLIVLTHAGIDIGIHDHNYASVQQILTLIDTVHPTKLVLAHMGNWACWQEVEQYLAGAPVWLDTAFSIGPVTQKQGEKAPYLTSNLSDSEFLSLARKHGMDKILFATDSPWESQKEYVERIKTLFSEGNIEKAEQDAVLFQNAANLLQL